MGAVSGVGMVSGSPYTVDEEVYIMVSMSFCLATSRRL